MRALEHILNDVEPLAGKHTVAEALEWMQEFKLSHLPWLEAGKLVGLVSEEDLLSVADPSDPLAKHREKAQPYFLREQDHLFNAMHLLGEANLTLLPVVDEEERYLGYLSPLEMIHDLGREVSFAERGSVLVLQVHVRDYHLSQITQIVESEDAHIIGLHLQIMAMDTQAGAEITAAISVALSAPLSASSTKFLSFTTKAFSTIPPPIATALCSNTSISKNAHRPLWQRNR